MFTIQNEYFKNLSPKKTPPRIKTLQYLEALSLLLLRSESSSIYTGVRFKTLVSVLRSLEELQVVDRFLRDLYTFI